MLASLLKSRCLKVNFKYLAWNVTFQSQQGSCVDIDSVVLLLMRADGWRFEQTHS
jgi:hypothetical protein